MGWAEPSLETGFNLRWCTIPPVEVNRDDGEDNGAGDEEHRKQEVLSWTREVNNQGVTHL